MNAAAELVPESERADPMGPVVRFRDPPPLDDSASKLTAKVAEILVRAPRIPIALPAFQLTLLSIEVDRRSVSLVVGPESPVARLRLSAAPEQPVVIGKKPAAVKVEVEDVHPHAERFRRELNAMAQRLAAGITAERWTEAMHVARELRELPVGVNLEFYRQLVPGVVPPNGLVRVGFLCNQDCGICWQDRDWARHPPEQVLTWIEDLYAAGARNLIVSGGEPTLDKRLVDYLSHAKRLGFRELTLETNAIQIARPGLAEKLRDAGLTMAFVSMHSPNPEVSDAITRAPGTHVKTVEGVRALLAAGVPVRLNTVLSAEGLDELPNLPQYVRDMFGDTKLLTGLMLSFPSRPYDPSLVPDIVPDPRRLRKVLPPIIQHAFELGLEVSGLDGPCGPPLCVFGADPRVAKLEVVKGSVDFRRHVPACDQCALRRSCFGVRDTEIALYGEDIVEPFAIESNRARPS